MQRSFKLSVDDFGKALVRLANRKARYLVSCAMPMLACDVAGDAF